MISVLIATKDRPIQLLSCVKSITRNSFSDFEVIIVDQTKIVPDINTLSFFKENSAIRYYNNPGRGKSKAINYALSLAKGNIFAFIDDDCIASEHWLKTIHASFNNHDIDHDIDAVFGNTFPFKPHLNAHKICPATINRESLIITQPCTHYVHVGFGNNMAIRRGVFLKLATFKTWLGPGSIGLGAMDAEYIFRMLQSGSIILHTSDMVVYHNKWLSHDEEKQQNYIYTCGELASYGYYAFQGQSVAKKIIMSHVLNYMNDVKRLFGDVLKRRTINIQAWKDCVMKLAARIRGFGIGLFFYIKEIKFQMNSDALLVN